MLVIVPALMLVQCGSDEGCTNCGGGGSSEPECTNEELTAGLYSFAPVGHEDDCDNMFALFQEFGLIPSGPFPIQRPGFTDLPEPATVTLPLPGSPQIAGTISEEFGEIVFTAPGTTQVTVNLGFPGLPASVTFPVSITGTLCPISDERVDATLAVSIPQAVPPFTDSVCNVDATLRGTR